MSDPSRHPDVVRSRPFDPDRIAVTDDRIGGPLIAPGPCAQGVTVRLDGRIVLRDVTLAIEPGWTAVVGPNGAGKSTLLRALAGLQPTGAGTVTLADRPIATVPSATRAQAIAWLPQGGDVSGELTVAETVALGRLAHLGLDGVPDAADAAAVDRAMAITATGEWRDRRLDALSGGERQRVLLARALATGAPTLLLDEPTTHLDAPHQVALARLFRALADGTANDGMGPRCVVTVLHDLPVALQADRLVVLDGGRLVQVGARHDPKLHRTLEQVFGGAIRIRPGDDGRPMVQLAMHAGNGMLPLSPIDPPA